MQINADLRQPAIVDSTALEWVPSPMAGVERRMLERDGEEVARATSLVRYAPGSAFSPHRHDAGEEFLVLDGVFSDETGNFPRGYYIRNPPGSRHRPASTPGSTILVKLRQMPPEEAAPVRIDTNDPGLWRETAPGREEALLFAAPWEQVDLVKLAPGHEGTEEKFERGVEMFVIEGDIMLGGARHGAGAWLRFPGGSRIALGSSSGVTIYRKSGHLPASV